MRHILIVLIFVFLTACQSITSDDESLALQADLEAYGTEAAFLRDQMQLDRTSVAASVEDAGTQIAAFTVYNSQLAATVQSGIIPTATVDLSDVSSTGPMSVDMFDLSSGEMRFVEVGTAGQITSEDRCFVRHQSFFNAATSVIYMTALALNLQAGTVVRVDWQYGSDVVYSNGWTAPSGADGQCIAIEFRPSNAPFLAGNWTATMYINGNPIDPAPFTINDS